MRVPEPWGYFNDILIMEPMTDASEPAHRTPLLAVGFTLLVYLHRLCRHAIVLSMQLESLAAPQKPLTRPRRVVEAILKDVGQVVSEGRAPVPWPSIEPQRVGLAAQLAPRGAANETSLSRRDNAWTPDRRLYGPVGGRRLTTEAAQL